MGQDIHLSPPWRVKRALAKSGLSGDGWPKFRVYPPSQKPDPDSYPPCQNLGWTRMPVKECKTRKSSSKIQYHFAPQKKYFLKPRRNVDTWKLLFVPKHVLFLLVKANKKHTIERESAPQVTAKKWLWILNVKIELQFWKYIRSPYALIL